MNSVQLIGRLTRDPETKQAANGGTFVRFTLAVDRGRRQENESASGPATDFIPCVAFGKTAEFVGKYFIKGQRIGLTGRFQSDSYTNRDGKKVYTYDVIADRVEFADSRSKRQEPPVRTGEEEFMQVPDSDEDEIPFF